MAKRKSKAPERLLLSLLLAGTTVGFIGFAATRLSYDILISEVATYAQQPGMMVARFINPTPPPWGALDVGCSLGVYTVAWFIILTMIWNTRSGAVRPHG
jgi:multisubunit Na+/H+ antiporter MnhB subunit